MRGLTILLLFFAYPCCRSAETDIASQAEADLFAARFRAAAEEYAALVKENPSSAFAHERLVRALLADHQVERAYAAAAEAARLAPNTAPVWNALGRVAYRKGNLAEAEKCFRSSIDADRKYADPVLGLAEIYSAISRFQSARRLVTLAYRLHPQDPFIALAYMHELKGDDQTVQLQRIWANLDPASESARHLGAAISYLSALHGRRRKLIGPAEPASIKLVRLVDGPNRTIGVGVKLRLNDKVNVVLRLDSGAAGIALAPQTAVRAGLEVLGSQSVEAKGLGDKPTEGAFRYLASRVKLGPLEWENFPVAVFRGARAADADGLIGTDVFSRFRVTIDFLASTMSVEPYPVEPGTDEPAEVTKRPDGYTAMYRFGHMLTAPTSMNEGPAKLFLIDSGAMINLVDIHAAADSTKVRKGAHVRLTGIQGEVKDVRRADQGTIVFAGFKQENPDLTAVDLRRMCDSAGVEISGVIGMQVLWHLKMTIDYQSGSLKLERSASDIR